MGASIADRFWSKVDKTETCWLWTASQQGTGYGQFFPEGRRSAVAHRFAYELLIGPIPDGLELDHLCRVRHCVNPDHLEPVTHAENVRRGARGRLITHCPQGHEYTAENLVPSAPHRKCLTCHRAANNAFGRARRASRARAAA